MLMGVTISNRQPGTAYVCGIFVLSVRTKRQIPTSWVLVLTQSAVSSVTLVGVRCLWNSLRSLLMMAVAELSTTNGIPSVSQEKVFSLGSAAVAYIPIFMVGNLRCDMYALNDPPQRRIRPLNIGYRYTISINVREKLDLIRPSGGSGRIYKRYTYGTVKRSGSL